MESAAARKKTKTKEEAALEEYEAELATREPGGRRKRKNQNTVPRFLYLSPRDKILFAKHLSVMLDAGIPLREALEAMQEQSVSHTLRGVLGTAIKDLSDGNTLGSTLEKFPKLFDPFFSNTVTVGESSGTLPSSLRYLAIQLEKSQELRGKVRAALLYPSIIFLGALSVGGYLAFYLLPRLTPLFTSLNLDLPATTRLLLATTTLLSRYWVWVLGAIVILGIAAAISWQLRAVRFMAHRFILWLPIAGRLARDIQTTQAVRILGTLLASGVKIVPALRITAASLNNLVYKKEMNEIANLVERGGTIGEEFKRIPHLFSKTAASMVAVGERTGKLSESLISLAEFTEREVDSATKNLSALIEPLVLIVVGVLVGFIALSIITPIYQLTQGLSQ